MILKIKEQSEKDDMPISTEEILLFMEKMIKEEKYETMLEIGTAYGYSSYFLAEKTKIKITSLELNEKRFKIAKKNISGKAKVINVDALKYETNDKFDLMYFDGPKSQNIKLTKKFWDNLNEGGKIVVDNIDFHGLRINKEKIINRNTKQLVRKIDEFIAWLDEN